MLIFDYFGGSRLHVQTPHVQLGRVRILTYCAPVLVNPISGFMSPGRDFVISAHLLNIYTRSAGLYRAQDRAQKREPPTDRCFLVVGKVGNLGPSSRSKQQTLLQTPVVLASSSSKHA